MAKDPIINKVMISENNSNKILRILKEDISKFFLCLGGTVATCFLPGVWAMAVPAIPFSMAIYYGVKALVRTQRIEKEDLALGNLESESTSEAQKEIQRQNHLLNDLKNASKKQDSNTSLKGRLNNTKKNTVIRAKKMKSFEK